MERQLLGSLWSWRKNSTTCGGVDWRTDLRAISLIIWPTLVLFSLAGYRRNDGICFNQRYFLELVPLAAVGRMPSVIVQCWLAAYASELPLAVILAAYQALPQSLLVAHRLSRRLLPTWTRGKRFHIPTTTAMGIADRATFTLTRLAGFPLTSVLPITMMMLVMAMSGFCIKG
jgi:hypothetical protein